MIFKKNSNTAKSFNDDIPADVQSIMEKYDRESNVRVWEGIPRLVVRVLLALFSVITIIVTVFLAPMAEVWLPCFVGMALLLGYIVFPHRKGMKKANYMPWYDVIAMLAGAGAFFYFALNAEDIIRRAPTITTAEIVIGIVGLLSLAELCRRSVGIPILCVAAVFVIYAIFWTPSMSYLIKRLFFTAGDGGGVLSTPIQVCAKYIVVFIIFGAFLEKTGISEFFINLANSVAGSASGGPAKVAVISSALCGMVSGSSVGNTVTTGSVTIPMMKETGYKGEFAGAVEAAASTGGQIMPPIMGAAAFLLAEAAGVPYSSVIVRAIIPALLYFTGIFISVHLEAKKLGLKGLKREDLPKFWPLLIKQGYLLLPLILLIVLVSTNTKTMQYSAAVAILAAIFVGLFNSKNRISLQKILDALESGAKNSLSIAAACGIAGIIAGVVTLTGLANELISLVVSISNGQVIVALLLTMVCCILLGMGVPTTANFCIMAATCAPILIQLEIDALPAYFFVFYFGIVADITPPVALAAYAGAAIAQSRPMPTAVNATKLAIAAFIVPYVFVLSPAMLLINIQSPLEIVQIVITSLFGIFGVAAGLEGYVLRHVNWPLRILLIIGGLTLIYPGLITDLIGIVIILGVIIIQVLENRSERRHQAEKL